MSKNQEKPPKIFKKVKNALNGKKDVKNVEKKVKILKNQEKTTKNI